MSLRRRDRILSIASPLGLLLVWEMRRGSASSTPAFFRRRRASSAAITMLQSGELVTHTMASLRRLFWGTLIGGVPALVLGVVMGLTGRRARSSIR